MDTGPWLAYSRISVCLECLSSTLTTSLLPSVAQISRTYLSFRRPALRPPDRHLVSGLHRR